MNIENVKHFLLKRCNATTKRFLTKFNRSKIHLYVMKQTNLNKECIIIVHHHHVYQLQSLLPTAPRDC